LPATRGPSDTGGPEEGTTGRPGRGAWHVARKTGSYNAASPRARSRMPRRCVATFRRSRSCRRHATQAAQVAQRRERRGGQAMQCGMSPARRAPTTPYRCVPEAARRAARVATFRRSRPCRRHGRHRWPRGGNDGAARPCSVAGRPQDGLLQGRIAACQKPHAGRARGRRAVAVWREWRRGATAPSKGRVPSRGVRHAAVGRRRPRPKPATESPLPLAGPAEADVFLRRDVRHVTGGRRTKPARDRARPAREVSRPGSAATRCRRRRWC